MQEKESIEKHNSVEKRDSARERIPTGTSFNHSSVARGANNRPDKLFSSLSEPSQSSWLSFKIIVIVKL